MTVRGTSTKLFALLQVATAATASLLPMPPWPNPQQQQQKQQQQQQQQHHGRHPARQSTDASLNISSITGVPTTAFTSYQTGNLRRSKNVQPSNTNNNAQRVTIRDSHQWNCTQMPIFTWGDVDDGGLGIQITNADTTWCAFFIYHNLCDYIPYKYIWINGNSIEFVSLPAGFAGRIVRGTDEWNLGGVPRPLGTWFEFALDNKSWIWGDVSLIRGCDGAVLMWALDDSGAWKGFTQWILDGAPAGAYQTKPSGEAVLGATEDWNGSTNAVPLDWEVQRVGADYAYVDDSHGSPVITSTNGRFATYWPAGRL